MKIFNIIKQNENKINHIHGQTVDDKGHVLKINLKRFKISDYKQHVKNNNSYKFFNPLSMLQQPKNAS